MRAPAFDAAWAMAHAIERLLATPTTRPVLPAREDMAGNVTSFLRRVASYLGRLRPWRCWPPPPPLPWFRPPKPPPLPWLRPPNPPPPPLPPPLLLPRFGPRPNRWPPPPLCPLPLPAPVPAPPKPRPRKPPRGLLFWRIVNSGAWRSIFTPSTRG